MDDFGTKLQETIRKFHQLDKVKQHLEKLEANLDEHYGRLSFLEKQLEIEYNEYASLEKGSLKGAFYKILGSKDQQLEKERQEYLQISLQYDECKESIQLMEFEKQVLEKKLVDHTRLKRELQLLKEKREQELMKSNTLEGKKLMKVVKEIDLLYTVKQDVEDAFGIGKEADGILKQMLHYLSTARNWGNWDMYQRRGGHWSAYKKHSNIDKAKELAYKAKYVLNRFEEELAGIYEDYRPNQFQFRIDSFSKFTDIFFDNLISDWIIQQRIDNAHNNVRTVRDRVSRIVKSLHVDGEKIIKDIANLEAEKEQIILDSAG